MPSTTNRKTPHLEPGMSVEYTWVRRSDAPSLCDGGSERFLRGLLRRASQRHRVLVLGFFVEARYLRLRCRIITTADFMAFKHAVVSTFSRWFNREQGMTGSIFLKGHRVVLEAPGRTPVVFLPGPCCLRAWLQLAPDDRPLCF